jgi:hypothetical protein
VSLEYTKVCHLNIQAYFTVALPGRPREAFPCCEFSLKQSVKRKESSFAALPRATLHIAILERRHSRVFRFPLLELRSHPLVLNDVIRRVFVAVDARPVCVTESVYQISAASVKCRAFIVASRLTRSCPQASWRFGGEKTPCRVANVATIQPRSSGLQPNLNYMCTSVQRNRNGPRHRAIVRFPTYNCGLRPPGWTPSWYLRSKKRCGTPITTTQYSQKRTRITKPNLVLTTCNKRHVSYKMTRRTAHDLAYRCTADTTAATRASCPGGSRSVQQLRRSPLLLEHVIFGRALIGGCPKLHSPASLVAASSSRVNSLRCHWSKMLLCRNKHVFMALIW